MSGPPFFGPPWGQDVVGMVLGADVDWTEVAELLTESFRVPRTAREGWTDTRLPGSGTAAGVRPSSGRRTPPGGAGG
jgi:hypothetical protein